MTELFLMALSTLFCPQGIGVMFVALNLWGANGGDPLVVQRLSAFLCAVMVGAG